MIRFAVAGRGFVYTFCSYVDQENLCAWGKSFWPTLPEQLDFVHEKTLHKPQKSSCSVAVGNGLSDVGQPFSSVSGRKRYNTLDFASKIVCQQGCFSPLLETQSQGDCSPLDTPSIFPVVCPNFKIQFDIHALKIQNRRNIHSI